MDAHTLTQVIDADRYDALYAAPFAVLGIRAGEDGVTGLDYLPADVAPLAPRTDLAREVVRQINRYLHDPAFCFSLPLRLSGTAFRQRVWKIMCEIPAGQTLTYGDVARRLDSAPRAVGGACGDNPIPLIVPCHRIVGRNGIGGFMHTTGQRETGIKRWLLQHEQQVLPLMQAQVRQ